jgi:hypothetical protein
MEQFDPRARDKNNAGHARASNHSSFLDADKISSP